MATKIQSNRLTTACMVINSIHDDANADPNTMLSARITDTHVVIITHRGQKFSVPIGTVDIAAEAAAAADAKPKPTTTIKAGPAQPAKTVKKTSRKRPTTTRKDNA